jgi:iron complex outermembrane receptor protein
MTVRTLGRLLLGLAGLAAPAAPAFAQQGAITGKVTEKGSGRAVADAAVYLLSGMGTAGAGRTDEAGTYRITGVAAGTYTLAVQKLGYSPFRQQGVVVGAAGATVDAVLSDAQQLNAVTITDGGQASPVTVIRTPAAVTVIGRERINSTPVATVADHAKGVPGIDIVQGGLVQSNVVARGFNNIFSGSLLVLTDNKFAFVPSLRVNVPYLIPTNNEDVERIEVLLGPAAALYGPNSAQGVFHVITRSPLRSQGTTLTVDGGERSLFRGAFRTAQKLSDKVGVKVSFDYMTGEDWENTDPAETIARDFDIQTMGGEVRVDWAPSDRTIWTLSVAQKRAGSAIEPTGLGAAQIKDWTFGGYQLRVNSGKLFGQVFLNTSDAGDTRLLRTGQAIVDKSTQLVAQLQHGFDWGPRQTFTYGVDYLATNPETDGTINGRNEDDDDITEVGGYLHSRTKLTDKFELTTALRVDQHSRVDDPVWSPRAALLYAINDRSSLRVTYNRAFSTPSSNNLFLDLVAGRVPSTGTRLFDVRTVGVPQDGLRFRRSCTNGIGGLCMKSTFSPALQAGAATDFVDASAARFYQAALGAVVQGGLAASLTQAFVAAGQSQAQAQGAAAATIQRLQQLQPNNAQVATQLRFLNPTVGRFADGTVDQVRDVSPIVPTTSYVWETGYKGLLTDQLTFSADLWYQKRKNFVGPLIVETPNVFLDRSTLTTFLANGLTPVLGPAAGQVAGTVATAMAGVSNGTGAATGVPLGVVTFDDPLTTNPDIALTYRNFGEVEIWGYDLGAEYAVTDALSFAATYSKVSDDLFAAADVGGPQDITLNAPRNKGSVTVRYSDAPRGVNYETRFRRVSSFPANSGVYIGQVRGYNLIDAQIGWSPNFLRGGLWSVMAYNLLNLRHVEFPGAAPIGRLVMTRVQYSW